MLAWCLNKHSCNFLFVSPVGLDFAILRSFWVPPNSPQKGDREKCFSFVLSPLLGTVFGFIFEVFCIRFFFLAFGRCRSEARSLHENKLSERHLYKDTVGP